MIMTTPITKTLGTFRICSSFNFKAINISAAAYDLFFFLVMQIKNNETELKTYEITTNKLSTFLKKRIRKNKLEKMKEELLNETILIKDKNINTPLLSVFEIKDNSITLKINSNLDTLLLYKHIAPKAQIIAHFGDLLNFKSKPTKQLYMIFKMFKNYKDPFKINIENLQYVLGIKSKNFYEFKIRILDKFLEELKNVDTLDVKIVKTSLESIKRGVKTKHLFFLIKSEQPIKRKKKIDTTKNLEEWVEKEKAKDEIIDTEIIDTAAADLLYPYSKEKIDEILTNFDSLT